MSLFAELRRRNVFKVGIAYIVASWLSLQVTDIVVPMLGIPNWLGPSLLLILAIGFPFALLLAWAYELTPQGIRREREIDQPTLASESRGRRLDFIVIAFLVFALGFFVYDKYKLRPQTPQDSITDQSRANNHVNLRSVAVLPFLDLSLRQADGRIGETIATEMQTELLRRSEFRVLSRSTTFALPEEVQSSQEIGNHLGVDILVEGTFRRVGDRIRVTVQLVSVADGYQLWSDVYEDSLRDDFSAEVAVAKYFSSQVRNRLSDPFVPSIGTTRFAEASDRGFSDLFLEPVGASPVNLRIEGLKRGNDRVE